MTCRRDLGLDLMSSWGTARSVSAPSLLIGGSPRARAAHRPSPRLCRRVACVDLSTAGLTRHDKRQPEARHRRQRPLRNRQLGGGAGLFGRLQRIEHRGDVTRRHTGPEPPSPRAPARWPSGVSMTRWPLASSVNRTKRELRCCFSRAEDPLPRNLPLWPSRGPSRSRGLLECGRGLLTLLLSTVIGSATRDLETIRRDYAGRARSRPPGI